MAEADSSADRSTDSHYARLALDYAASISPAVFFVESVSARRLLYVSANAKRVTGYSPAELTDSDAQRDRLVHPDDKLSLESMREAALRAGTDSPVHCDYRLETPDGFRWFRDERTLAGDDTFAGV